MGVALVIIHFNGIFHYKPTILDTSMATEARIFWLDTLSVEVESFENILTSLNV